MKKTQKTDNRGMTLAELIVTFALAGIFLASVAAVISSSVIVYSELTGTMYAQSVSEILLDKVTGELAAAEPEGDKAFVTGQVLKNGAVLGEGVSFYDRNEKHSCFYVEEGILILQAEDVWRMDENAYMGYRITDFSVNRLNEKNVFEVTVKIKNLKTGFEYTASKVTASYQFETENDFEKIVQEEIVLGNV